MAQVLVHPVNPPIPISVIVAAQTGGKALSDCLAGLAGQSAPDGGIEVIVVLPATAIGAAEQLAAAYRAWPLCACPLDTWGTAAAFNRGAELAQGQVCLFLTENARPTPGLLDGHWRAQSEGAGCVSFGLTRLEAAPNDWLPQQYAQEQIQRHTALAQDNQASTWAWHPRDNLSVPRGAFSASGGFDPALPFATELDLAYRLEKDGLAIKYLPDAQATQTAPSNFSPILSALEKHGAACVSLYQRYPAQLPRLFEDYGGTTWRAQLLRQVLLALHFSPVWLASLINVCVKTPKQRADWYTFLRSYCFWRGVRQAIPDQDLWRCLTYGTPILMYHAFTQQGEQPSRYIISSRQFARQLAWLKWLGYRVISLEEFLQYRLAHRLPPAGAVVITIDDGYADNHTVAYPILRRFRFPATIFLISQRLGQENNWDPDGYLVKRPTLTREQAQAMLAGKITFGSHTCTHPFLPEVTPEQARDEITGSRLELERALGRSIRTFSYPHGEFNAACQALVLEAGYWGACGTRSELNYPSTPRSALLRTEIRGTDSLLRFILALIWGENRLPPRRPRGQE